MATEPEGNRAEAPKGKHWLSRTESGIVIGTVLRILAGMTFGLMSWAAFENEEKAAGIVYIVLAIIFVPSTITTAWWMGRD